MDVQQKYDALLTRLSELGSVLVAYSGGIDSTLLAFCTHAVLGPRCKAVLAISDTYPTVEVEQARELASRLGFDLLEVETYELADPRFAQNTADRCYYCKSELFGLLSRVADVNGLEHVADGSNADDLGDFRPGSRAKAEYRVVSPLQEVGMSKAEIRELAKELGLPNWDKPSMACLASRFPYGDAITEERLEAVGRAEAGISTLGLSQFRVRAHGLVARLEVVAEELDLAWRLRAEVAEVVRAQGFTWVALDLDGYRTGSLNEGLPEAASD